MSIKASLIGALTFAVLSIPAINAVAGTEQEEAINSGAERLTSEEIADLLVGKTVTAKSGEKKFYFYYSEDNVLSGKLIGGDWSDTGYYGITDDDRVCVSITKDKGRLRCLTVLRMGSSVRKYNVNGKMTFELLEFREGNHL